MNYLGHRGHSHVREGNILFHVRLLKEWEKGWVDVTMQAAEWGIITHIPCQVAQLCYTKKVEKEEVEPELNFVLWLATLMSTCRRDLVIIQNAPPNPKSTKNGDSAFNSYLALILSRNICQISMHVIFINFISNSMITSEWLRQ